jgi:hypothetical protein
MSDVWSRHLFSGPQDQPTRAPSREKAHEWSSYAQTGYTHPVFQHFRCLLKGGLALCSDRRSAGKARASTKGHSSTMRSAAVGSRQDLERKRGSQADKIQLIAPKRGWTPLVDCPVEFTTLLRDKLLRESTEVVWPQTVCPPRPGAVDSRVSSIRCIR